MRGRASTDRSWPSPAESVTPRVDQVTLSERSPRLIATEYIRLLCSDRVHDYRPFDARVVYIAWQDEILSKPNVDNCRQSFESLLHPTERYKVRARGHREYATPRKAWQSSIAETEHMIRIS